MIWKLVVMKNLLMVIRVMLTQASEFAAIIKQCMCKYTSTNTHILVRAAVLASIELGDREAKMLVLHSFTYCKRTQYSSLIEVNSLLGIKLWWVSVDFCCVLGPLLLLRYNSDLSMMLEIVRVSYDDDVTVS